MGIDAVITAGDGRAAKKVFRKNKALLDVAGKPMIRHIVEVLIESKDIDQIVLVGPKDAFTEILSDLDIIIVEQGRNLCENAKEGFLNTIPEYREKHVLTDDIINAYRDKHVIFVPGDVPLLTVWELEDFISMCDMEKWDYVLGITPEESLRKFSPRKGRPGIKMATFHTRDGNYRQNNLHMVKPFYVMDSMDIVLKVYDYRYQKEFVNILKSMIEIVRLRKGIVLKSLFYYLCLQLSTSLSMLGMEPFAWITSYPVTISESEKLISRILKVRFKSVCTTMGGAALDVDNEKDFLTLSVMYKDWMNMLLKDYHLAK
ncbi:MAG: hypothetical protein DRG37_05830 [Deltaproteobacteria bacterium]|nr:MAG: hypothetical protein DRG37_05830 [Deltaproteobacteria bacterium]